MSDIAVKIKQLLQEKFEVKEYEITDEASFVKDLGIDSIDMIELLMDVETEFGIDIPDEEMEKMTSVGSLIEYITKRITK